MPDMEQTQEELAVAAVMLVVKAPMDKVIAAYLNRESFQQNSDVIEFQSIQSVGKSDSEVEKEFQSIGFTEKESSEVKNFMAFKGGTAFNLSSDEIKQIQEIDSKDPAVQEKSSRLLRRILAERYQVYFKQGLEAVQPYDRGGGKYAFPRRELTVAAGSIKLLENHFPDFYQSLLKYPEVSSKEVKSDFFWFKNKMDDRSAYQLSHYMSSTLKNYAIVAELQFYVGSSYNSMLTIIGCVPYEDGTIVFCTNRTFTDQVTGFGSSIKRSVGRRRIEDAISEHFAKLRSMLEPK